MTAFVLEKINQQEDQITVFGRKASHFYPQKKNPLHND